MKSYTKYLLIIVLLASHYTFSNETNEKKAQKLVSKMRNKPVTLEDFMFFSGLTGINILLFSTLYQEDASLQMLTMSGGTVLSLGAVSTNKCIQYIRQLKQKW